MKQICAYMGNGCATRNVPAGENPETHRAAMAAAYPNASRVVIENGNADWSGRTAPPEQFDGG